MMAISRAVNSVNVNSCIVKYLRFLDHTLCPSKLPAMGTHARGNLDAGLKALRDQGVDPKKTQCVIDLAAGTKFRQVSVNMLPTVTRARGSTQSFWLTKARFHVPILIDNN